MGDGQGNPGLLLIYCLKCNSLSWVWIGKVTRVLWISDDCEMLKALYDFEATLTKTLSFCEGEFFYLQQNNTKQRNWWHVVNRKGQVGFVPSNYVASVKVNHIMHLLSTLTYLKTLSII